MIAATAEELEKQLLVTSEPKQRVQVMLDLGWQLRNTDTKRAHVYSSDALAIIEEYNYEEHLATCFRNLGYCTMVQGNQDTALLYLRQSLQYFARHRDRVSEGLVMSFISMAYAQQGDYEESVNYASKSYQAYEEQNHTVGLGWGLAVLGYCHLDMGNYDQALNTFEKGYAHFSDAREEQGMAFSFTGIGTVHKHFGSYGRALEYLTQAMRYAEKHANRLSHARSLLEIGRVHQLLGNRVEALRDYNEALQEFEFIGNGHGQVSCLLDVGRAFLDQAEVDQAFVVLFKAQNIAKEIKSRPKLAQAYKHLSAAYALQDHYEEAYQNHLSYHQLTEQIFTYEARAKLLNQQIGFLVEKSRSEAELLNLKNGELSQKNTELVRALELTNDSIVYASRIQSALLPTEKDLRDLLPNSFIYYKPRDIVSGDFYWLTEWNDYIVLAAVDCTGHGVPGAFMSVLGQTLLSQVVKEKYNYVPANILQSLDNRLNNALQHSSGGLMGDVHDGMEAGIVTINLEDKTLQYAGANIPLYLCTSNGLITISPTHASLGGGGREEKEFQNHIIPFNTGDALYLFSDGYRDQFGLDANNKQKYSTKRFQRLIEQVYPLHMQDQKIALSNEFDNWRGKLKQLDDVMVVGIKF